MVNNLIFNLDLLQHVIWECTILQIMLHEIRFCNHKATEAVPDKNSEHLTLTNVSLWYVNVSLVQGQQSIIQVK